jgi:hypothetical protein
MKWWSERLKGLRLGSYAALSFLFLPGCGEEKSIESSAQVISINIGKDTIDQVTIEQIIPFESKEEAIFRHVTRMAAFEDKVVILDSKRAELFLFDNTGHFLKKTPYGRGPGELLFPNDLFLSREEAKVWVRDGGDKQLKAYDFDLNHTGTITFPELRIIRWFNKLPDGNWLVHFQNSLKPDDKQIYSYLIYGPDFMQLVDSLLPDPVLSNQKVSMYNPISRESAAMLFCRPFDHHLYTYEKGETKPLYFLDFGDNTVTPADVAKEYKYVYDLVHSGQRVSILGDIIHTEAYVAISFVQNQKIYYLIYSKQSGRAVSSMSSHCLPKGVLKGMADDSTFILIVNPEDFLEFARKKGMDEEQYAGIQPGGNNVMVLFRLEEALQ